MRGVWVTSGWLFLMTACGKSGSEATDTSLQGTPTPEGDADTDADADSDADSDSDTDTDLPTGPSAIDLYVNEFMAANTVTIQDSSGAFPDWIELYNPGAAAVALDGFALTDNAGNVEKWVFAVGSSIPAGGFLLLYADQDVDQGPAHTAFDLAASGGDIVLLDTDRAVVDQILGYPAQSADISLARHPDGATDWVSDATPSPAASNN